MRAFLLAVHGDGRAGWGLTGWRGVRFGGRRRSGVCARGGAGRDCREQAVRLRVAATGDLLIHSPVFNRALQRRWAPKRLAPMSRYVRRYVTQADLAICHVETPMTSRPPAATRSSTRRRRWRGRSHQPAGTCAARPRTTPSIRAGSASTIAGLNRAGVGHAGSYRSAAARRRPAILTAKGLHVAFLSYTEHTNGISLPAPWSVNLARAGRILAEAGRARRAGAQVVIVNAHAGDEYRHGPSALQRRLARRLLRSRTITAVLGEHATSCNRPPRRRAGWSSTARETSSPTGQPPAARLRHRTG